MAQAKEEIKDIVPLDYFNDVALSLTVELGRIEMNVREFLKLIKGSVIELNKRHGEPLDVIANSKLIAKGEVVVVNDNFGIRITQIESPDNGPT